MEIVSATESVMAHPPSVLSSGSSISTSSMLTQESQTAAKTFSSDSSVNLLTVHSQNGQYIFQQPLKTVTNGPTLVSKGTALSKGIIVRQKPLPANQLASAAATFLGDKATLEKAGIKRPLIPSGNNVITKVIITKNSLSGQPQAFPVGSSPQTFALAPLSISSNIKSDSQQPGVLSAAQPVPSAKTLTISSQGAVSPVKTMVASVFGTSVPFHKIATSPIKTPTKMTVPVSGSPGNEALSSNIAVLSHALSAVSQTGSTSKVIIKQGPAPTGSTSFTLKGQSLPTLAPQLTQIRASSVVQGLRAPVVRNMQPIAINSGGSVQQIQVPGSRFHYVRLVSPANNTNAATANGKDTSHVTQPSASVVPLSVAPIPNTNQVTITLPVQQQNASLAASAKTTIPVSINSQQRIILPATSSSVTVQGNAVTNLVPIQPAPAAGVQSVNSLPPGAAVISAANIQGLQSFALVPASYVTQFQQQLNKSQTTQATIAPSVPRQARDYVPIASIDPSVTQYTVSRNAPTSNGPTLEATGARPRKPCNCTKSQCLKLYCDCFANGEFCQNCNCTNCANNLEHEEERSKAIKCCLDRNPQAFHPKIGKSKEVEGSRQHQKGCNCKRSGCLKNYCECYEAKIMCSNFCKCIGCKNFEESPELKTLMHLADAAEVRVQQQTAAKTKLASQISCVPTRPPASAANGERLPFALITADVAEATSACLLAQAEEAERMKMPPVVQERMIIEEFGRCLLQIIESANRTASSLA